MDEVQLLLALVGVTAGLVVGGSTIALAPKALTLESSILAEPVTFCRAFVDVGDRVAVALDRRGYLFLAHAGTWLEPWPCPAP